MSKFVKDHVVNAYASDVSLLPVHVDGEFDFDLLSKTVRVAVTTTVKSQSSNADSIILDAVGFFDVQVEDKRDHHFNYDGKQLSIWWDKPFSTGDEHQFTVRYGVIDPISGLVWSVPDENHMWRPLFACADNETERARYWVACIDHPHVRTTLQWTIVSDEKHTIIANGVLQSETVTDGRKRAVWKLEQVCPSYLYCIGVGELVRYEDGAVELLDKSGKVPLEYYSVAGVDTAHLKNSFGTTGKIMSWMQAKLNHRFPYPKYFQIAAPKMGGAMENVSLTTWDQIFVLDDVWKTEFGQLTEMVNVHEMTHSYFGDSIGMRYFEHAWLKESWANYMEIVWLEDQYSVQEQQFELFQSAKAYFSEAEERYVRPIVTRRYNSSWNMFDQHLYPGGAYRIHMLRKLLGDSAFWAAVQEYVSVNIEKLVETSDFRRVLEKHAGGMNLTRFFDQWFHGIGFPIVEGEYRFDHRAKLVTLTFKQVQDFEAKQSPWELFVMSLDVVVVEATGIEHSATLRFDGVSPTASVSVAVLSGEVTEVRLDPDTKLLFKVKSFNPGEQMVARTARLGTTIQQRLWAYETLIKMESASALHLVKQAIKDEPFWGVRGEVAAMLSACVHTHAVPIMLDMLRTERNPQALTAICASFASCRDHRLAQPLRRLLNDDATRLGYRATSHLLVALASQHTSFTAECPDWALLCRFAENDSSYLCLTRAGALRAIGKLRTMKAFQYLENRVHNELDASHPAAIEAFAEVASWQPRAVIKRAVDVLESNLRVQDQRVLYATINALVKLQADWAIPQIQRCKALLATQYHPFVDKQLDSLSKAADNQTTQLKSDIEKLTIRLQKLELQSNSTNTAAKTTTAGTRTKHRKSFRANKSKNVSLAPRHLNSETSPHTQQTHIKQ